MISTDDTALLTVLLAKHITIIFKSLEVKKLKKALSDSLTFFTVLKTSNLLKLPWIKVHPVNFIDPPLCLIKSQKIKHFSEAHCPIF